MKFSESKNEQTATLSIWQRRMNTKALEACTKGNTYREMYDIVMNHLNTAIKEVDEFIEEKRKEEEAKETETDEAEIVTDVDSAKGNRYGASGSSAGLSDSEIKKLRGPVIDRGRGRPVCKRLMSSAEKGRRASAKKKKTTPVGGHRGLPYQSSFCTKCRKPGVSKEQVAQTITIAVSHVRNVV